METQVSHFTCRDPAHCVLINIAQTAQDGAFTPRSGGIEHGEKRFAPARDLKQEPFRTKWQARIRRRTRFLIGTVVQVVAQATGALLPSPHE